MRAGPPQQSRDSPWRVSPRRAGERRSAGELHIMQRLMPKGRLASDPRFSLNAICPYFTMFPVEFPLGILKRHREAKVVADPFCGRGTTLYAARVRGVRAYGIDCSPV